MCHYMIQSYNTKKNDRDLKKENTTQFDSSFFKMKECEALKIFSRHLDKWFICYDKEDFHKE